MSEETALKLKQAKESLAAAGQELETLEREFLAVVAAQIPSHANELARKLAKQQADVTKGLGAEKVKDLRANIEEAALRATEDVAGAASRVKWEVPSNIYTVPNAHEVNAAMRSYLRRSVLPEFVTILKAAGFTIAGSTAGPSLGSLYSEEEVTAEARALGGALLAVAKAEQVLTKATEADNDATINELWGD
ncbi:hypothetical protein [Arthrobacter sp. D5-1]|uniref:hypothetical protein n=1 Tax=Arthrobacter sp. D5-1 TaxID=1477518 RepID=UPI001A994DB9|nr:hypothetical protein [Arthrobacter sp. D5-1]